MTAHDPFVIGTPTGSQWHYRDQYGQIGHHTTQQPCPCNERKDDQ